MIAQALTKILGLVLLVGIITGCAPRISTPPPSFSAPRLVAPPVMLPPPPAPPLAPRYVQVRGRVVIDAGHGGKDPGTRIRSGIEEKDINLAVARLIAQKLRGYGVDAVLTRNKDVFVELIDRARSGQGADLFVSIHADSNPSPLKTGHSLILPAAGSPRATLAGQLIDRRMRMAGSPPHALRLDNRGLLVLRRTPCPAVLVELGFLSNNNDAARLTDPAYRARIAEAIANGIADYLARK